MLVQNNQTAHILYYEVLDIPLPELECLKTLEVSFHHATKDEVSVCTIGRTWLVYIYCSFSMPDPGTFSGCDTLYYTSRT
ncbi:hypothetical protein IFM89_000307 [Coptis chinensis]|uniref:Uncharacterized protein n=1 Tax=Coptis chinensis TaxID=261450 RepID=A0A835LKZ0_9MAGN|nr:hypothetical protein IFM89_000307 [Coptis chinensis]